VPALTWLAFALGNISLYIYAEKYTELQSIIGQLATAALQIYVVYLILLYRRQAKPQ
jgi:polyferredoxin